MNHDSVTISEREIFLEARLPVSEYESQDTKRIVANQITAIIITGKLCASAQFPRRARLEQPLDVHVWKVFPVIRASPPRTIIYITTSNNKEL
jgi:hypothetical protein